MHKNLYKYHKYCWKSNPNKAANCSKQLLTLQLLLLSFAGLSDRLNVATHWSRRSQPPCLDILHLPHSIAYRFRSIDSISAIS